MRKFIIAAPLMLAACEKPQWDYWDHPWDPQVKVFAMDQCLERAQGPRTTHYNDADEVVEACERYAEDIARYCPPNEARCSPQYRRSRADVRMLLKGNL